MLIRFKKKTDGQAVFTAVREDGSSTTTMVGAADGFGPVHDLSHYVVERALGYRGAFLGLLAAGKSVQDFEKGARQWLRAEAMMAEAIAGQLSQDAMSGNRLGVEDFNSTTHAELSEAQLATMHRELEELRARWEAVAPGETLELIF